MKKMASRLSLILLFYSSAASLAQGTGNEGSTAGLPAGMVLPKTGSVYLIEGTGKDLVQLHATEIVANSHAAGNLARSAIYVGARASIELPGLNAAVHLSGPVVSVFVRINSDDPELMRQRIHLIKMEQTKDRRVVAGFSQNIFGGQRAKKYNDIAVDKVDAEPGVWLKVTPVAPLVPGEYGIAVMPKDASLGPDSVYDFDVAFDKAAIEKK